MEPLEVDFESEKATSSRVPASRWSGARVGGSLPSTGFETGIRRSASHNHHIAPRTRGHEADPASKPAIARSRSLRNTQRPHGNSMAALGIKEAWG